MAPAINESRFLDDLFAQGKIGWRVEHGLQRLAYSTSYLKTPEEVSLPANPCL